MLGEYRRATEPACKDSPLYIDHDFERTPLGWYCKNCDITPLDLLGLQLIPTDSEAALLEAIFGD